MADTSNKPRWALGMMSGTSCDGIDAALVETDGETEIIIGAALAEPYEPDFRAKLMSVMGLKGPVAEVEKELTERHAAVAKRLLSDNGLEPKDVALIGFHGQTLLHQPDLGRTKQIGDGALLAKLMGIDVVNDFRSNDMAHGGQGAPFVPLFHAALAASMKRPVAVLNIGGVANVTWVGEGAVKGTAGAAGSAPILAFDTGPGNALMDDWALKHTGQAVDKDGALAAKGKVNDAALAKLMSHPYFAKKAPKSLDRNDFDSAPVQGLSPEDGAATLAAFTVACIVKAVEALSGPRAPLDRRRRRPPQPRADGRPHRKTRRPRRPRRTRRLERRHAGGPGVRVLGGALGAWVAAQRARHDGRKGARHRREAAPEIGGRRYSA